MDIVEVNDMSSIISIGNDEMKQIKDVIIEKIPKMDLEVDDVVIVVTTRMIQIRGIGDFENHVYFQMYWDDWEYFKKMNGTAQITFKFNHIDIIKFTTNRIGIEVISH